ncbi:SRPBCC family protein [Niabella insulamsoli]|uniref:SRPBCC family protein n=1 Tax=Niabella insulamsoli TaxID=3144874 RepID=UPI0031FD51A2
MSTPLLFDFSVDKENKTIHVKREFAGDLSLVWKAWTDAELLDQWWAPKPWKAETKSMNFTEGGRWLYAMVSPEGEKHWSVADYEKIEPQKSFAAADGFSDENGNLLPNMPRSKWNNRFSANAANTTVDISIKFDQLEDLEKIIEMGFKEGFTMGMENLDALLLTLK